MFFSIWAHLLLTIHLSNCVSQDSALQIVATQFKLVQEYQRNIKERSYLLTLFKSSKKRKSLRVLTLGLVWSWCSNNIIRTQLLPLSLVSAFLCVGYSLREDLHRWRQGNIQQPQTYFSQLSNYSRNKPLFPRGSRESSRIGFDWIGFFLCPSGNWSLWHRRLICDMGCTHSSLGCGNSSIQTLQTEIGGGIVPQRKIWVQLLKRLGIIRKIRKNKNCQLYLCSWIIAES